LIRRRRECGDCQFRFTTYERVERRIPWILKRDDRREPYSRDKLLRGLTLACRKRPLGADDIEGVVSRVESWLEARTKPDVTSVELGRAVLKELREVDPVAYVRFSSVYLAFESVEQFI
jgi:transcriptional repressor NrdR